jgi:hypothetical protein
MMRLWVVAVALCLPVAASAQEGGGIGWQTYELPSQAFGDNSDLGKYNYLGKLPATPYQIPGEGSPFTIDSDTLKKFYCPGGVCPDNRFTSKPDLGVQVFPVPGWAYEVSAPVAAPVVPADEIRLDNPQSVELGLRLTVAGVAGTVSIEPAGSYTRKLSADSTAIAEIASGSTVTTTSLLPGRAYAIQVIGGAYFIVPTN